MEARIDARCSGTDAAVPFTPHQPIPVFEIGSQSQVGSTHEEVSQFDDAEDDGYVALHDEYIYFSDVDEYVGEVNVAEEVSVDYDPTELSSVHEEPTIEGMAQSEKEFNLDPENPNIEVGALFPNVYVFRKALRQFAKKNEFEVVIVKTDKKRFIGKCSNPTCPWRIHASVIRESNVFKVKVLPHEHTCPSTAMSDSKMASKSWVSDRVIDWMKKNPSAGARDVQNKLEGEYHVKVSYIKVWSGREAALNQIHGSWEGSFEILYNYKQELEKRCPGSIVEVDHERVGNKIRFKRVFVALKPCVDGFLHGCRPYLGVDSTHLTGKYKGQFAAAVGIDGHNWLYHVAYGAFDLETTDNWEWFLTQLRRAIGTPLGLTISSDMGKGLEAAIPSVFPDAEHRECMRHLMKNFKKKFHGDVYSRDMYSASMAYSAEKCQTHVEKLPPTVIDYLKRNHKAIWCRSQFSEMSKVNYVNNNISECFNAWIKKFKGLHLVDLLDQIRQLLLEKFNVRRSIVGKFKGLILPSVIKELNVLSRNCGRPKIVRGGNDYGEISGVDMNGNFWRHVVELDTKKCSCLEWQITGKPCMHVVAFICSLRGANMEDYVHEYYSVARFKVAYAGRIPAMPDKSKWEKVNLQAQVFPPEAKRPPGRPRKERIPGCLEPGARRQQCKRCKQFGHQQRTCKVGEFGGTKKSGREVTHHKMVHQQHNSKCKLHVPGGCYASASR